MRFRGLTWDHPRGRLALERAGGPVDWDVQPLEGFESAPIAENCAKYDLVVLDHPHLGEALVAGCLQPLDEIFAAEELTAIGERTIGRCLESYESDGRVYALPLDAATQVMACRPDLLAAHPQSWEDVLMLARETRAASKRAGLCLAGPHAFLSFLSIAQAMQPELDLRNGDTWVPDEVAEAAIALLAELATMTPATTHGLNPIGMLEHMASADDVLLCPLVYGYVNYAASSRSRPLAFHDAPRVGGSPPGTILGGTGIAVSTRCAVNDELRAHLLWLMSADVQAGFIPENAGQPSARAAWLSEDVNAPVGGFYRNTAASLEAAAIRPRHDGYIAFQSEASAYLRQGFDDRTPETLMARGLAELFARSKEKSLEEARI